MPFHKGSPGCACCGDCTIFADDFERADTSTLGSSWEERSGDWSIASNAAICDSANGLMISTTSNPTGTAEAHISAVVRLSTANDVARLVLGYVDDNNYYFANVRVTSTQAHIKIVRRQSGSNTDFGFEVSASGGINTDYLVSFCRTGAVYTATITKPDVPFVPVITQATVATSTGLKAGIGTGTRTGIIQFKDVSWQYLRSKSRKDCPVCGQPCIICQTDTWPYALQLEFSGVVDGANCSDCEDINDTVYLAKPLTLGPVGIVTESTSACTYLTPVGCSLHSETWLTGASSLFIRQKEVRLYQPSTPANPDGLEDARFGSGPAGAATNNSVDCSVADTVTCTFDRSTASPGLDLDYCIWEAASCLVTPLL